MSKDHKFSECMPNENEMSNIILIKVDRSKKTWIQVKLYNMCLKKVTWFGITVGVP